MSSTMGIYYFSAVAFLATTAGFVGLGIVVYRRAQRSAEVNVLLLMLLYFSLQSFLLSLDALFFGILSIMPDQAHELLSAASSSLQLLSFAAVLHFVFLTFSRTLDESGLLADPFSRLRDYKGQYWFWVCFIYSMPVLGIARYAHQVFKAWQAEPLGELKLPPMPSLESSGGFLLIWWFFFTLRIAAILQQRRASPHKLTVIEWFLAPFRIYSHHDCVLRLSDYQYSGYDPKKAAPVGNDEWMTSLLLSLWILLFLGFAIWTQGSAADSSRLPGVLWFLLPSVFVVPLIYYRMRFVFFDVLIKRGLIAILLLVSSALYCGLILVPARSKAAAVNAAAGPLTLFAGTILFIGAWLALHARLNQILDRHLFRRADYGSVVSEIDEAMKQFVEPGQLLDDVRNRLRSAMDAESVEFIPQEPPQAGDAPRENVCTTDVPQRQLATAEIPLSAAGRVYGVLKFGKRTGGFRYQSEDLAFMTTVVGHLAEMLHNFELRSEREEQQRREEVLRSLAEQSELRALRAQINPHFLFNALNSLADLTQEDPKAAEGVILHLSHIFRYALDASRRESVSLEEELGFVESYLAVERLRFEDRLRHEIVASAEARRCWLPPMLIQPIVENAVKHGISCKMSGGTVTIRAAVEDQKLRIEIADDGIGFDLHSVDGPGRQGVGLENVRSRLKHVTGRGSLQVDSTPGRGTRVSLEIPVQQGEDPR
jgi:two-component system LytT family sensor kinase